jgi:hypothetical protein
VSEVAELDLNRREEGQMSVTIDLNDHDRLLADTLAEMHANEPEDDGIIPGHIDGKVDDSMTMWYIAYSTS